ncbi:hypothetical protein AHF37_07072 [Paragonimus kellicotti]|nr:hypothetical protein AHF37_07072 [Paragonimus kellicotti]
MEFLPEVDDELDYGCRSVEEFECLNRIEEGTYGVVYRARDRKINEIVALKRLKMEKERDGFPITSLREINTLMKAQHENIVTVREVVVGSNMDKIYLVMDYVEHDLKSLMENEEELLAPSAREGDRYRGGGATHVKSNSQGQRSLLSPREEGEEEDEEDDEEETGSTAAESRQGHAARRRQHRHHHTVHDREEGEASSEDDQRRSRISSTVEENSFRKTKQSGSQLLLDEAEYRHRLHERHERRERERLHNGRSHKRQKSNASTRDLKSDFPPSRSNSAAEQSVTNVNPESSSEALQGEKKWQAHSSASSNKGKSTYPYFVILRPLFITVHSHVVVVVDHHRRNACDVPYREDGRQDSTKKSKQKRTDELETDEIMDSHLSSSDVVPRSHSNSFLPYGHAEVGEMQYHIEALTERTKKKAKVKRSRRDHHDKSEVSSKKGTRPFSKINSAGQIVVYADWEAYVREKSKRHSQVPTSPHSSNSSSRQSSGSSSHSVISTSSSSSSKSPAHKDRLDTSNSRRRSSTQAAATYEDPQSLVYMKHKRSHKYRRETREGAPPLESGRSQVLDSESGRRHKSEKHSLKLSTRSISYPSKRSRTTKDVRNKEDPDLDLTRYHSRDTSESRSHVKSRVTTEGLSRDSQSGELQASSEETASTRLLKRRATISSRSPFKDEPVSNCSDDSVGKRLPISNNSSELTVKSKGEVEEEPVVKPVPKPSRFQQYRLYSESDSDDDVIKIMNGPFSVGEVKCLLVQLLRAVRHLHDNWILHRDLKTSNLLLSHQGILKVSLIRVFFISSTVSVGEDDRLACSQVYTLFTSSAPM